MCAVAQWTCCISSYLRYDHRLITVAWNPDLSRATGGSWQPQLLALQRKSKWDWCYRLLGWQQPACICLYIESSASATENCICKQRRPLPVKFGGGGGENREEKPKNYSISPSGGVLMTSNPGWRCPTFVHCCELLGWAPASIQAAVT